MARAQLANLVTHADGRLVNMPHACMRGMEALRCCCCALAHAVHAGHIQPDVCPDINMHTI
jgi:hypothetical protein